LGFFFQKSNISQRESKDNQPTREAAELYKDNCFGVNLHLDSDERLKSYYMQGPKQQFSFNSPNIPNSLFP